ncbi:MAG: alpha/beta hydrolase [Pseudomonadota bacterium]
MDVNPDSLTAPREIAVGSDARTIAVQSQPGEARDGAPGFLWLGGYRSDMSGGKAVALAAWGESVGRSVTRMDYSGHGLSGGRFEDGTIQRWMEEAEAVFLEETRGPQVLVGSSMGGWIALLLAQRLASRPEAAGRIAGLMLIAPAWNMASLMWAGLDEEQRAILMRDGIYREPSEYGESLLLRDLIEAGRALEWTDGPVRLGVPVRILQGLRDADVPAAHVMKLLERLEDDDVVLTLVKDGDHRLSRPQDLDRMLRCAIGF